jgi:hypothetical protein
LPFERTPQLVVVASLMIAVARRFAGGDFPFRLYLKKNSNKERETIERDSSAGERQGAKAIKAQYKTALRFPRSSPREAARHPSGRTHKKDTSGYAKSMLV